MNTIMDDGLMVVRQDQDGISENKNKYFGKILSQVYKSETMYLPHTYYTYLLTYLLTY